MTSIIAFTAIFVLPMLFVVLMARNASRRAANTITDAERAALALRGLNSTDRTLAEILALPEVEPKRTLDWSATWGDPA